MNLQVEAFMAFPDSANMAGQAVNTVSRFIPDRVGRGLPAGPCKVGF